MSWCILALALAVSEPGLSEFGYAIDLRVDEDASVVELELPRTVYEHTTQRDLGDLRVWNAAGERLAHELAPPAPLEAQQTVELPIFPLPGTLRKATGEIEIRVEERGDTIVRVQSDREEEKDSSAPPLGFLIDTRRVTDKTLDEITLRWDEARDFVARFRIESSSDLDDWYPVLSGAAVAHVSRGADRLVRDRFRIGARVAGPYARLLWEDPAAAPPLTAVIASVQSRTEPRRVWSFHRPSRTNDALEWDTEGHAAFDALILNGLPENTFLRAVLQHQGPSGEWQNTWSGSLYRLIAEGVEIGSEPPVFPPTQASRWRLELDAKTPLGNTRPTVRLGFRPHRLSFIAKGPEPYTLSFGHAGLETASTVIDAPDTASRARPYRITAMRELSGAVALVEPPVGVPTKTIVLWAILAAAVGFLGFVAFRLAKQL